MTTTIIVTPIEFDGTEVELHGEAFHRFVRVKRLRGGESVRVVDGEGRARRGVVARLDRARAVVALAGGEPSYESRLRVELLVAPPELARAAWLVEKATELGVAEIRWVITERCARNEDAYGSTQLARLRRVAHAAVEQCGRAVVPEIGAAEPLAGRLAGAGLRVALDPEGGAPDSLVALDPDRDRELIAGGTTQPRLVLFVGPEGGWSPAERAAFEVAGVRRVVLGERILRVETAAIVAAGLALTTFR